MKNKPWNKGIKMPQISKEKNPNWKGGLPNCLECKKQLSRYDAKLCKYHSDRSEIRIEKHRQSLTGYKHTEETKLKMSKNNTRANLGKTFSEEWKKKIRENHKGMTGKKHSEATLAKIRGENSSSWKGGITPINLKIRTSLEYKEWRKAVFKRDDYRCYDCGAKSGEAEKRVVLHADHILPFAYFPRLRFDVNNGRTLCSNCHKQTDTFAGRAKAKKLFEYVY